MTYTLTRFGSYRGFNVAMCIYKDEVRGYVVVNDGYAWGKAGFTYIYGDKHNRYIAVNPDFELFKSVEQCMEYINSVESNEVWVNI